MIINQVAFKSFSFLAHKITLLSGLSKQNYLFSQSNDKDDNSRYKYPFNFNRQEYKGYIKKVNKAEKLIDEVQYASSVSYVPRRKRRVYDKQKFDTDITNYAAWRLCDPEQIIMKHWEHALPVKAKLLLQPKWVIHAFGLGLLPCNHHRSANRQYIFEDNNLSRFLLYEFRNTTKFKKNEQNFDYQNQQNLRPSMRKTKRLDEKDFWESQQFFQFRINSTAYAEHMKFCKWVESTVEAKKTQQSYDQFINKKFGSAFSFNTKTDQSFYNPRTAFIVEIGPQHFQQIQQKVQKQKGKKQSKQKKQAKQKQSVVKLVQPAKPSVQLERKLSQQLRKKNQKQSTKKQSKATK